MVAAARKRGAIRFEGGSCDRPARWQRTTGVPAQLVTTPFSSNSTCSVPMVLSSVLLVPARPAHELAAPQGGRPGGRTQRTASGKPSHRPITEGLPLRAGGAFRRVLAGGAGRLVLDDGRVRAGGRAEGFVAGRGPQKSVAVSAHNHVDAAQILGDLQVAAAVCVVANVRQQDDLVDACAGENGGCSYRRLFDAPRCWAGVRPPISLSSSMYFCAVSVWSSRTVPGSGEEDAIVFSCTSIPTMPTLMPSYVLTVYGFSLPV